MKRGGAMWIKASGTWLSEADSRDIMVPVDVAALREAIDAGETPDDACVVGDLNATGLRASIETSVHAVLDMPVVLHTHCVATIAVAVRQDAERVLADRLRGIPFAFIPYVKPGWDLARSIGERVRPETRVLVLGNHGLVASGETVAEAEALLREVSARLEPRKLAEPMTVAKSLDEELAGTGWKPAPDAATHAVALDPPRLAMAEGATLYPDHLIFLGPGVAVATEGETPDEAVERCAGGGPTNRLVLFPGLGAAVPGDASPSLLALARCLGDVLERIEPGAPLSRLTEEQEAELLNWDAEKHRQTLNRKAGG